jgi:DNA-binding NtrC family response regulator
MKEGAYDYITKPFKVDAIRIIVEKAIEKKSLSSENRRLRSELRSRIRERHLIGTSRAMQRVVDLIAQVAATKANVLISGESGTARRSRRARSTTAAIAARVRSSRSTAARSRRTCSSRSCSGT